MVLLVLLMAIGLPPMCDPRVENVFQEREYDFTGGRYHNQRIHYRLYAPEMKPGQKYPLILWLHGYGEGGDDNRSQLRYIDWFFTDPVHPERFPAFFVLPQCIEGNRQWYKSNPLSAQRGPDEKAPDDMLTIVMEILDQLRRDYPIDENRLYVGGICIGAGASLELGMRHPNTFAAIMPFTVGHVNTSWADRLAGTVIWSFVQDSPSESLQEIVDVVNATGGHAHVTVFPLLGACAKHNWYTSFETYGLTDWLLLQRRDAWCCWNPPGLMPRERTRWYRELGARLAFPGGIAVVGIAAWCFSRRRSGKVKKEVTEGATEEVSPSS